GDTGGAIFDDNERALPCDDRDLHTALAIVECLIAHTAHTYSHLNREGENPFADHVQGITVRESRLYNALPDEFTTAEFTAKAIQLGITKRTAERTLGKFWHAKHIVDQESQGRYRKTGSSNGLSA
ncbi:MAG: hypothetical protein Q4E55_09325, partial [Bacteroidales bacterium]|nr:hypothetical protein [Bacteroidales bacterium]